MRKRPWSHGARTACAITQHFIAAGAIVCLSIQSNGPGVGDSRTNSTNFVGAANDEGGGGSATGRLCSGLPGVGSYENSELLPTESVAVAAKYRYPDGTGPTVAVKLALPAASVVTVVEPRYF